MHYRLAALIALLLAGVAPSAQGALIVDAFETGPNVMFTGSGSLNLGAWTNILQTDEFGRVFPNSGDIVVGPTPNIPVDRYQTGVNFSGPSSFGTGSDGFADSGSDDIFGIIFGADDLIVPRDYVSGDPLSGSSTYLSETFASLGMTPGTYTWSWGSGSTADSFTLKVGGIPQSIEDWEEEFSPLVEPEAREAACGSAGGALDLTADREDEISELEEEGILDSRQARQQRQRLANTCMSNLVSQVSCQNRLSQSSRNLDRITCNAIRREDHESGRNCNHALNNLVQATRLTRFCRQALREECQVCANVSDGRCSANVPEECESD
jgi:hypothetical protein